MTTHHATVEDQPAAEQQAVTTIGPATTVNLAWMLGLSGSFLVIIVGAALWITNVVGEQQKMSTQQQKELTARISEQAIELARNATKLAEVASKLDAIVLGITRVNDNYQQLSASLNAHEREDEKKWTSLDGRVVSIEQSGSPSLKESVRYLTEKIQRLETALEVDKAVRETKEQKAK